MATAIAYICNPLLYSVAGFVIIAHFLGAPPLETTWIGIIGLTFFKVLPLAMLAVLIRLGKIETVEIRARERRTLPLLLGIASMTAGVLAFHVYGTDISRLIAVIALVSASSAGVLTFITLWWKISIHASGAGAFAGLAVYFLVNAESVAPTPMDPLALASAAVLLVPAVSWARVHTGAHTPAQVVVGTGFGFIMSILPLYFLLHN